LGREGEIDMTAGPYQYIVMVDDNFHYQDESERRKLGDFTTYTEAIAACKYLVDKYLQENCSTDKTAAERYELYTSFGPDPFVVTNDPEVAVPGFSAWEYAKQQCESQV
jgi:hypothetical protein